MGRIDRYIENNLSDVNGKKVIVTGANSGIGFSISDILLSKHAHVVMACRNPERAKQAFDLLTSRHPNEKLEIAYFDQSSLDSIRDFANQLTHEHADFFALILNAGVFRPNAKLLFESKVPLTIGTNYLGPLYLITLLQDFLKSSLEEKRIIFQGSLAFHLNHYHDLKQSLTNTKNGLMKQYNLSKLGITNMFYYYSISNLNSHIKYLLAEPGVSNTQIIRNYKKWFKSIASGFLSVFTHSNQKAALSACYLTCAHVANGDYVHPRGLLSALGFPHYTKLKEKHINYRIVFDALEVIDDLNGK